RWNSLALFPSTGAAGGNGSWIFSVEQSDAFGADLFLVARGRDEIGEGHAELSGHGGVGRRWDDGRGIGGWHTDAWLHSRASYGFYLFGHRRRVGSGSDAWSCPGLLPCDWLWPLHCVARFGYFWDVAGGGADFFNWIPGCHKHRRRHR